MPLFKPSIKTYRDEARKLNGFTLFDFLHGYVYAAYIYLYIGIGTGALWPGKVAGKLINAWQKVFPPGPKNPGAITFADTYHGKVVPLSTARQLVSIQQDLQVSYPEQVIPYKLARDLLLHDPTHIVVIDCPCRVSKPEHCEPLDVCLVIGEPFASMVVEHHPKHSRWIDQAEAARILEAEEQRGHVHHAFFKDAMLGRFYAICNCCACCCAAMHSHRMGTPMLASSGYLSRVDQANCVGCSECVDVCQFKAIHLEDGMAVVDDSLCMGCGVCVTHCPNEALALELAPWKGVPMTLPAANNGG